LTIDASIQRRQTCADATRNSTKVFIYANVAIIIDTIARFSLRIARNARLRLTIRTIVHHHVTSAHATHGHTQQLVNRCVAIVINAIARFCNRHNVTHTLVPLTTDTRLATRCTSANILGSRWTRITRLRHPIDTGTTFVHNAIAIVIRAVARFVDCRWKGNAFTHHTHRTTVDRNLTSTHSARNRPETIVDVAIAIIIETITNLYTR
jgi:hypothetical protein